MSYEIERDKFLKNMAERLVDQCNSCCNRSDGFEEKLKDLVFFVMETTYSLGKLQGRIDALTNKETK